jgi:hypothetical protein
VLASPPCENAVAVLEGYESPPVPSSRGRLPAAANTRSATRRASRISLTGNRTTIVPLHAWVNTTAPPELVAIFQDLPHVLLAVLALEATTTSLERFDGARLASGTTELDQASMAQLEAVRSNCVTASSALRLLAAPALGEELIRGRRIPEQIIGRRVEVIDRLSRALDSLASSALRLSVSLDT